MGGLGGLRFVGWRFWLLVLGEWCLGGGGRRKGNVFVNASIVGGRENEVVNEAVVVEL